MPGAEGWKAKYVGLPEVSEAKRLRNFGDMVQERSLPRRSLDGHTLITSWDRLHECSRWKKNTVKFR